MVEEKYNYDVLLNSQLHSNTFHEAIKSSLKLVQCFGFFPVQIGGPTYKSIKLKWLDWRTLFSAFTMILITLQAISDFYYEFSHPLHIMQLNGVCFNMYAILQNIFFLRLALHWPKFVREWYIIELRMTKYKFVGNLKKNLNIITSIVTTVAMVEHALINIHQLLTCYEQQINIWEGLRIYFVERSYQSVFIFVEYTPWKGLILEFMGLQMAFMWTFADIFLMLIGESLRFKLKQLSEKIKQLSNVKVMDTIAWHNIRKDYVLFTGLIDTVNKEISIMMIFSFSVNLYFVLHQMFNSLRPIEHTIQKVYTLVSFGLLVIRIASVILLGSGVNDEWRNLGIALNSVKSSAYNIEIAATIVTYELVLIQFNIDLLKKNV